MLIVEAAGLTVAPVILRERSAYRAAWPLGKGVTETEPLGKAAGEIGMLRNGFLNNCRCAHLQDRRKGRRLRMARRSLLTPARDEISAETMPEVAAELSPTETVRSGKPSRQSKLHIGGYYNPSDDIIVSFQKLGIDLRKPQQEMLYEAIRDYVAKHQAAKVFR